MFEITTISLLLLFTILGGLVAKRLGQPVILGLLIIGTIFGPHMLGIIKGEETIEFMTEIGTILFLFVIGLEFSVKKLLKIGPKAIVVTLLKVGIMFTLGFVTVVLFGLDTTTAVFVGIIISFSSTMITLNVIKQKKMDKRPEVPLLIAVLIIEDIIGILALTFFSSRRGDVDLFTSLHTLVLSLVVLIVVYIIFSKIAERIVGWIIKHSGDETTAFISLGICAGFAYLATILNLSPGVGAFLGGSIVSTFRESKTFEKSVLPYTAMFTSLFFLSMGTTINLTSIFQNVWIILALLAVIIFGMVISVGLVTRTFADFDDKSATFSTVAMLPLGVFSLLIAKESSYHSTEIDLVTVASVLLFVLAIVMSITINYVHKLTVSRNNKIFIGATRFASYMRESLDEFVIETTYTKRMSKQTLIVTMLLTLELIVALTILRFAFQWQGWLLIALLVLGVAALIALTIHAHKHMKEANKLLIRIISGIEGGTTRQRTSKIVEYTGAGLIILIGGLFSPMLIFLINLPSWTVLFSLALIAYGLYLFAQAVHLLKSFDPSFRYATKSYKKMPVIFKNNG